jgi:hypothetical protein
VEESPDPAKAWGVTVHVSEDRVVLSIVPASAFRFLVHRTWVFQHDARRA